MFLWISCHLQPKLSPYTPTSKSLNISVLVFGILFPHFAPTPVDPSNSYLDITFSAACSLMELIISSFMIPLHLTSQGAIIEHLLCARHYPESYTCTLLLILMMTFETGNYFQSSHFTDKKTKALKSDETVPGSQTQYLMEPNLESRCLVPKSLLLRWPASVSAQSHSAVIICLHRFLLFPLKLKEDWCSPWSPWGAAQNQALSEHKCLWNWNVSSKSPIQNLLFWCRRTLAGRGFTAPTPIALLSFETLSPEPLGLLHTQFITSA